VKRGSFRRPLLAWLLLAACAAAARAGTQVELASRWQALQTNARIQARLDRAIDEAGRIAERIEDDPDYREGFLAGLEEARSAYLGDCGNLLASSESSFVDSPPEGYSDDWEEGYREGQLLVYYVRLARGLRGCFVPLPPELAPAPAAEAGP
jgi:hypothetical protein